MTEGHATDLVLDAHPAIRAAYRFLETKQLGEEVEQTIRDWAAHLLINRGLGKEVTIPSYIKRQTAYLVWCQSEGLDFRTVTQADIERWQRWLFLELNQSNRTRMTNTSTLRAFYDWLLREKSPAARVPTPRWKPKLPKKYSTEQLRKLFATCDPTDVYGLRDLTILLFLYATGARCMEVVSLDLEHLQLRNRTGKVQFYGKGSKERLVSIEGPVVDILRRWILRREQIPCKDTAVFVSVKCGRHGVGARISKPAVEAMLSRRAKKAGLREWGVHRFRVTYATDMYDDGIDLETIRTLLGHDSIETTRRYIQISDSKLRTRMSSNRQRQALSPNQTDVPRWIQRQLGELESAQRPDD